jgi:uncharacterized membrane protein YfcA
MSAGTMLDICAVVLAASAVQGTVGFGFALFTVPLLGFVIDTKDAVVIASTIGVLGSTALAVHERRHCDRPAATRMIAGAAMGAPLGLAVITVTPERGLRAALAIMLILFLVATLTHFELRRASPRIDVIAGIVSGVLGTSLSTNGPPLVAVLHGRRLEPAVFRATLSLVFAVSGIIATVLFAGAGRFDHHNLTAIAICLPALAAGYAVGHAGRRRIDPDAFRGWVLVLLGITAAASLFAVVAG